MLVAAAVGLLLAAIPPAPEWSVHEAEAWAVPPVRASVGPFIQSDWHPAALIVEAFGWEIPEEQKRIAYREWTIPSAGLALNRDSELPNRWAPFNPAQPPLVDDRDGLSDAEQTRWDAWWDAKQPRFRYAATASLWAILVPAALLALWRACRPPASAGAPGLLRQLARPWVGALALFGGAAIGAQLARAWLPTDWPVISVRGEIGPADTPHPRLIRIDAEWPIQSGTQIRAENQDWPRLGLSSRYRTLIGGLGGGGLGGGLGGGGFGGGAFSIPAVATQIGGLGPRRPAPATGVPGRAFWTVRVSLWWLLLPAELANLVTLFRARPRRGDRRPVGDSTP